MKYIVYLVTEYRRDLEIQLKSYNKICWIIKKADNSIIDHEDKNTRVGADTE
jgi:hypothetical protein